jgi:hypothetical protein
MITQAARRRDKGADQVPSKWGRGFAMCHRRLGVLYKCMGRYADAEVSTRMYIAHLESDAMHADGADGPDGADARQLAAAYTLLSTILEHTDGRSMEARQSDLRAGELMATRYAPI